MLPPTSTRKKAIIIGCGIAGPVLAMFLHRAGISSVIYEGRPEPRDEAGFFLNLAPNGHAVLETLGIADEIARHGAPTTSIAFFNHRGKQLGENSQSTTLLRRGLLTQALREAARQRGIEVVFGKRFCDVETTAQGTVVAQFEDGSEARGDLLVGCDGIHSRVRRSLMPGAPPPAYTGVIDSGAFTRAPSSLTADGVMRMTFGLTGFFGYQTVPAGETYWFENYTQPKEPDRDALDAIPDAHWRQALVERHRHDHAPIAEIIRSTDNGIGRWPIYDLPSLPTWHDGRICLIGDAAHATSPHAGQGASLAMEDAVVLAKCLRDIPETEGAFTAFEALRKDRVEAIVKGARRTGNQKAPANAATRALRDLILPFFIKHGLKHVERIYAYRVDWDSRIEDPRRLVGGNPSAVGHAANSRA